MPEGISNLAWFFAGGFWALLWHWLWNKKPTATSLVANAVMSILILAIALLLHRGGS